MAIRIPKIIKWTSLGTLVVLALLMLGIFGNGAARAQSSVPLEPGGYYTKNGKTFEIVQGGNVTITKLGSLTPTELEARFPMSSEAEASIIHTPPSSPVTIDGAVYKPEDISKFNGHRLRFAVGPDGNLYGFTTAEGLEQFQVKNQRMMTMSPPMSGFWMDWLYTGDSFSLAPGYGFPYLSQIYFDDQVSSTQISDSASLAYIFDYENFGGDYFFMAGGSSYPALSLQGWNDRASSVYVAQ